MTHEVKEFFEDIFTSSSLSLQIEQCEKFELAGLIRELFRRNNPTLEAGCGSGKWNAYLHKNGVPSVGLDWSQRLCAQAKKRIPESSFISGDLQNLPFADKTFGGILSLGSIEHVINGPEKILKEFHRVLRDDGKALITVPYRGKLKSVLESIKKPVLFIKRLPHYKYVDKTSLREISKKARKGWHPVFNYKDGEYYFYQYEFNHKQMRAFLGKAGFHIEKEFAFSWEDGIVFTFGKMTGAWNEDGTKIILSPLGKILKKVIPSSMIGHMLCYVVSKE